MKHHWKHVCALLCLAFLAASAATPAALAQYSITVLHNNDGESNISAIDEFTTLVKDTRSFYSGLGHGVVTVYAGDSFIPSPEFQASLDSGPPGSRTFFSALAFNEIGYDAAVIGNHEFDAGPSVLGEFVQQTNTPYVSANLDFSGEPALSGLVGSDIFTSTTVTVPTAAGNKTVGIIGATTENLPFISSVGGVTVGDVATAVNNEVAALGSVDHVILVSHLQGISEDLALAPSLNSNIDLVIAGGGDEILADLSAPSPTSIYGPSAPASVADTGLLAGDTPDQTNYPNQTSSIPVVTSGPEYGYLGRVTLSFDAAGNLVGIDNSSNPQANIGFSADATVKANVVDPVENFVSGLASNIIAQSSETLVGNSDRDVIRAKEAGLGNLVADGIFSAATMAAPTFGVDSPDLAFVNGGGIRDDINTGDISVLTTFDISPFGNIVSIVEDVEREDVKRIFENAYSKTIDDPDTPGVNPIRDNVGGTGRFLHVSEGVEVVYDISADPLQLDGDGNVVADGSRILSLTVNGEVIVEDGVVVPGDPLDIATLDFLAGGGDQIFEDYLSQTYDFTRLGISDQNALQAYLEGLASGDPTFDVISDSRYDNVPDGRIVATIVPEPATIAIWILLGSACLLAYRRRRRR